MKQRLLPCGDGDSRAISQVKFGVGILCYIVEIHKIGFVDLEEKERRHFFTYFVKPFPDRDVLILRLYEILPIGAGDVQNVVNQNTLLSVVSVEEDIHIGTINVFHGLVQAGVEPAHIEGLGEVTKRLKIHGVVLVFIIIGDKKQSGLAVTFF